MLSKLISQKAHLQAMIGKVLEKELLQFLDRSIVFLHLPIMNTLRFQ